ncbi:uncharacterized protein LOC135475964 [Liolophura sinensis]|uniref:uncharacterized protein LOC135475964 n=1 Tax=Liolophura sinensis TaxID=3198878 RepID=UPI003158F8B0
MTDCQSSQLYSNMESSSCLTFAAMVNAVVTLWVCIGRQWSFSFLANAMFFPTILSVFFVDSISGFFVEILGLNQIVWSLVYSVLSVGIVYAAVWACVGLDLMMGWGKWIEKPTGNGIHDHNSIQWRGFLRAAGEEIGWRCYLLPCLMNSMSPFMALCVSGIAWGLFHVAVMVVLVRRLHPPRPVLTVAVQCLCVTIFAFPHGWVAIKAGYAVWPSTVMHCVWNRVNPRVLGSIYTHQPGLIAGNQWLINGEGLAGCVVMLPVCVLIVWNLSY